MPRGLWNVSTGKTLWTTIRWCSFRTYDRVEFTYMLSVIKQEVIPILKLEYFFLRWREYLFTIVMNQWDLFSLSKNHLDSNFQTYEYALMYWRVLLAVLKSLWEVLLSIFTNTLLSFRPTLLLKVWKSLRLHAFYSNDLCPMHPSEVMKGLPLDMKAYFS
jgi:hypothetical protein